MEPVPGVCQDTKGEFEFLKNIGFALICSSGELLVKRQPFARKFFFKSFKHEAVSAQHGTATERYVSFNVRVAFRHKSLDFRDNSLRFVSFIVELHDFHCSHHRELAVNAVRRVQPLCSGNYLFRTSKIVGESDLFCSKVSLK